MRLRATWILPSEHDAYLALVGYGEREGNPTLGLGQFWTSLRLDSSPQRYKRSSGWSCPNTLHPMISFTGLSPEVAEAMCTPMHLILPSTPPPASPTTPGALYLGSITAVLDPSILKEHDIHHLVQVLDVPWLPAYEEDGYECYRLDILDTESQDLRPHLEDTVEDIDSALRRGRNVLVHCHQVSGATFSFSIFLQPHS